MPRDLSGNMTLPAGNPVVSGTTISSTVMNNTLADLAAEVQDSLSRSGKGGMSAAFKNADGTEAAPGMTFTNETGTGWYRSAAGKLRASILGAWKLLIEATGVTVKGILGIMDSGGTNKIVSVTAPSGLAADYTLTLPTGLPAATGPLTLSSAGVLAVSLSSGQQFSSSSGTFAGTATTLTDVTNLSVSITTTGRAVRVALIPDGTTSLGAFYLTCVATARSANIQILRDATNIAYRQTGGVANSNVDIWCPEVVDTPAAGTYTYKMQYMVSNADATFNASRLRLVVYEI